MGAPKHAWTMGRVARASGRSVEYVASQCRTGLLPEWLMPRHGQGQAVILAPEVAEALIPVFASRLPSPELPELMRERPAEVLRAAEALAELARLSMQGPEARMQA